MTENLIKNGLLDEEIEEIRNAFKKYDINKTGKIDVKRFLKEMISIGLEIRAPIIYKIFKDLDNEETEKKGEYNLYVELKDLFSTSGQKGIISASYNVTPDPIPFKKYTQRNRLYSKGQKAQSDNCCLRRLRSFCRLMYLRLVPGGLPCNLAPHLVYSCFNRNENACYKYIWFGPSCSCFLF